MGIADPQAKRLYDMENVFMKAWLRTRQPLPLLQNYADKACRRWRVPLVHVQFSTHSKNVGQYFGDEQKIKLYSDDVSSGRNIPVLLHEVAHHIDDHIWNCDEGHGPVFAAIEMDLLDHYKVFPAAAYKLMADRYRVKIARLRKRKPR